MPVLTGGFDGYGRPILDLYVSICSTEMRERREEGNPTLRSIPVRAMIDTGAGQSHVDLAAIGLLGIFPVSEAPIYTASGTGAIPRDVYLVDISLAGDQLGVLAVDHKVFGSPLDEGLRVDMLLGRDILERCILTHDGINRRFTLAYNPPKPSYTTA